MALNHVKFTKMMDWDFTCSFSWKILSVWVERKKIAHGSLEEDTIENTHGIYSLVKVKTIC